MVTLKYLSNFWRTLKIPLINCEINLMLTWSEKCFMIGVPIANEIAIFELTDTKHYIPVVTLSTQGNRKLLQQLKSSFKTTINWNKCQSKVTAQEQNRYLNYLNDRTFEGTDISDYNIMINGQNMFD